MQDLNVISKINAEAAQRDIPVQQAAGKYVVAEYSGLHYVAHHVFDTEVDANAKAIEIGNKVGQRASVYNPTV